MEQFTVISACTLEEELRRKKEIEQLRALIRARCEKAQSTERYLRLFGDCKGIETVILLQRHLLRTIESIWEMRMDLARLESAPPRAAVDV